MTGGAQCAPSPGLNRVKAQILLNIDLNVMNLFHQLVNSLIDSIAAIASIQLVPKIFEKKVISKYFKRKQLIS